MAFSPRRSFALAGVAGLSTCAIWVSPARPAEEGWPSPMPVAGGNPVHGKPVYAGPGDLLYFWEDGAGLRVAPVSDGGLGPTQDLTQNAAIDGDLASDEHGDAMTVRGERSSSTTSPQ